MQARALDSRVPVVNRTNSVAPRKRAKRQRSRACWATALLAAALYAGPAEAQRTVELVTTLGTITVQLIDDPGVEPFADLFSISMNRVLLRGALFHESDKNLQCSEDTCSCIDFDCTQCENLLDPFLECADGEEPVCTCEDESAPSGYECTMAAGPGFVCDDMSVPTCLCDDGSEPAFACSDGSTPPGSCLSPLVQTDLTQPSAALYFGLSRLGDDGQVVDVADYIPASMRAAPGIFENDPLMVAFVRDTSSGLLTSEVVINVADNSNFFDNTMNDGGTGASAYLVFGQVTEGSDVVDALSRIPTFDASSEIPTALSCSPPPPPLTSWVEGLPDATRCTWDQFPLVDPSGLPAPRFIGSCVPGDVECLLPECLTPGVGGTCDDPVCAATLDDDGTTRCTHSLLPECLELGQTFEDSEGNEITPCLDPVCDDTFDDGQTHRCTEPEAPNFPYLLPEPAGGLLSAVALLVVAAARRSRRR